MMRIAYNAPGCSNKTTEEERPSYNIYNFISPFLIEEKKTNNHTINNKKAA